LKDALDRKRAADAAVVENSAKEGCAANCRELLRAQANAAYDEVEQARAEMQKADQAAKEPALNELDAALVELDAASLLSSPSGGRSGRTPQSYRLNACARLAQSSGQREAF
jgi:hypothetical protein